MNKLNILTWINRITFTANYPFDVACVTSIAISLTYNTHLTVWVFLLMFANRFIYIVSGKYASKEVANQREILNKEYQQCLKKREKILIELKKRINENV